MSKVIRLDLHDEAALGCNGDTSNKNTTTALEKGGEEKRKEARRWGSPHPGRALLRPCLGCPRPWSESSSRQSPSVTLPGVAALSQRAHPGQALLRPCLGVPSPLVREEPEVQQKKEL